MLTHKNITDTYDRFLVWWALCELRKIKPFIDSTKYKGYWTFPCHNRMYATYDMEQERIIYIDYKDFEEGEIKRINLFK